MKSVFLRNILLALLFLCLLFPMGCNISDGSDDTTEPEITEAEDISALKSFFASDYDSQNKNHVMVIEDLDTLNKVCAVAEPPKSGLPKYLFRGNIKDANYISTYTEDYFKTGYLIAVYRLDGCGNLSHELSATKNGNTIDLQLKIIEPPIRTEDIGAYVYVTAVEGKYNGEEIKINITKEELRSEGVYYFKSFFESDYSTSEKNARAFVIEDSEALRQVCEIADPAPNTSKYFFRGNVKDPDYISTYTEEYFKTGYLIAVYKLDTISNLSHEISAVKDGNTVNVQIKRIEPPVRENMIGAYVYVIAVEGKYNGEEIKLNIEETAIESVPGETYEHKDY